MKVRDEIDVFGGFTKEHKYLGESKQHIMKGHVPHGTIPRKTQGTSKTLDESAGNIPDKDEKY